MHIFRSLPEVCSFTSTGTIPLTAWMLVVRLGLAMFSDVYALGGCILAWERRFDLSS